MSYTLGHQTPNPKVHNANFRAESNLSPVCSLMYSIMSKQADTVSLPFTYLHNSWPKSCEFFKTPCILCSLYYVIRQE